MRAWTWRAAVDVNEQPPHSVPCRRVMARRRNEHQPRISPPVTVRKRSATSGKCRPPPVNEGGAMEGAPKMMDNAHGRSLMRPPRRRNCVVLRLATAALLTTGLVAAASVAQARITRIQIVTQGIAFGGHSFPLVGQYQVITGVAFGEVDPANPQNAVITDLQLAPRNARGKVEYSHNF